MMSEDAGHDVWQRESSLVTQAVATQGHCMQQAPSYKGRSCTLPDTA